MKFTADHIIVATNLVESMCAKADIRPHQVKEWGVAWQIVHLSCAYTALYHAQYADAHWETAMKILFPNLPPR